MSILLRVGVGAEVVLWLPLPLPPSSDTRKATEDVCLGRAKSAVLATPSAEEVPLPTGLFWRGTANAMASTDNDDKGAAAAAIVRKKVAGLRIVIYSLSVRKMNELNEE